MDDGEKLCELCGMHKKLNIGPAGALWLEKDGAGDAVLMVEPVVGRTLPVAVPVWFCPACGRDFRPRKAETEKNVFPIGAEHLEYLKKKAEEMQGTVEEALDRVLNDCYWADKEKAQKAREDTTDETGT